MFVTIYVYIVYLIALRFEGCVSIILIVAASDVSPASPFTDMIYSNRAASQKAESKKEL